MSLDNTIEELIQRVRDITDEENESDVSDDLILRMLNRAQQELVRILTKRYNNYFMREEVYSASTLTNDSSGQGRVLALPSQSFGFAINSVDVKIGTAWVSVKQVPIAYTLGLDNAVGEGIPLSYAIQGNKLYLYSTPSSNVEIRVRYQFRAPKLVKSQGRITAFNETTEAVTLDSLGPSLSTSVDDLSAFVNIIDHLTGDIKATVQLNGITTSTKTLQLKTASLDRETVFGYTVVAALPTTISYDDYVCTGEGTCVPLLSHDLTNFLVDIAGFYTKRKLGTVEQADFVDRDAIFKAVSGMQFGRQHTKKILRNRGTGGYTMQWFFRGS